MLGPEKQPCCSLEWHLPDHQSMKIIMVLQNVKCNFNHCSLKLIGTTCNKVTLITDILSINHEIHEASMLKNMAAA